MVVVVFGFEMDVVQTEAEGSSCLCLGKWSTAHDGWPTGQHPLMNIQGKVFSLIHLATLQPGAFSVDYTSSYPTSVHYHMY